MPKRSKSPKWAQAVCIAWPVASIYLLFEGWLRGDAEWRVEIWMLVGTALLLCALLIGVFLLERWSYVFQWLSASAVFVYEVFSPFRSSTDLQDTLILALTLLAIFASLYCLIKIPKDQAGSQELMSWSRRAGVIVCAAGLLLSAWTYGQSFRGPEPDGRPASARDWMGEWWGIRPGQSAFVGMAVRMLAFENGGEGKANYGFRAIRGLGGKSYWLMRGNRLHVAKFSTDAWSHYSATPAISADGSTLSFGDEQVFGASTYYRAGSQGAKRLQLMIRQEQGQFEKERKDAKVR